jgi:hypothetical protein
VYPQPRLGTRYEKSLKRRFEKADQVLSEIYLRKARLDKKGLRAYTAVEFRQDLYATAFGHGLCAEALMAYFKVLHRREILRLFSEVRAKEERGISGHSGELRRTVLSLAVILTLFSLLMLVPGLYHAALLHWNKAIPLLMIGPAGCVFAVNFWAEWLRIRQRDGDQ